MNVCAALLCFFCSIGSHCIKPLNLVKLTLRGLTRLLKEQSSLMLRHAQTFILKQQFSRMLKQQFSRILKQQFSWVHVLDQAAGFAAHLLACSSLRVRHWDFMRAYSALLEASWALRSASVLSYE